MTHEKALEQNAAERYLLAEMSPAEREEFELHYFCCTECAAALNDGAEFLDTAGDLMPAVAVPERREPFWQRWFPAPARPAFAAMAAALVLVSGASVQQIASLRGRIAEFETPRQVPAYTLLAARRGPVQTIRIPNGSREVQLQLDVTSEEAFPSYRIEIGSAAPIRVDPPGPSGLVHLLIPTSRLPRGEAALRVQGQRTDGSLVPVITHQIAIQESQ